MSEEPKAPVLDDNHQKCTSQAVEGGRELPFRCPACGGEQLGYGLKTYNRVVIYEDGAMEFYGGDRFIEESRDFMCWDCNFVIVDGGKPIRRAEDMAEWLKAHSAGGRG